MLIIGVNNRTSFWVTILSAILLVSTILMAAGDPKEGQKTFENACIGCHGPDGSGTDLGKSLMAPDLRSEDVQKVSDAEFTEVISKGKNSMPPFSNLSADEIASVIAYVRTFAAKK